MSRPFEIPGNHAQEINVVYGVLAAADPDETIPQPTLERLAHAVVRYGWGDHHHCTEDQ